MLSQSEAQMLTQSGILEDIIEADKLMEKFPLQMFLYRWPAS